MCGRCYSLYLKKRAVEKWNLARPETLKYYPKSEYFRTDRYFESIQKGFISQVEARIYFLRTMGQRRQSCHSSLSVEYKIRRIGELAGAGFDLHYGCSHYISQKFSPESRTALFNLLRDIEEAKEKFRFSLGKALDQYANKSMHLKKQ